MVPEARENHQVDNIGSETMSKAGNGSDGGGFQVDFVELGPGWTAIEPGKRRPSKGQEIAALLDNALRHWLGQHPNYSVRSTLGIVAGGNTQAIHIWYTQGP